MHGRLTSKDYGHVIASDVISKLCIFNSYKKNPSLILSVLQQYTKNIRRLPPPTPSPIT